MERQRAEAELAAPEGQGIRLLAFGLCSEKPIGISPTGKVAFRCCSY